jgi:hypothetical protein
MPDPIEGDSQPIRELFGRELVRLLQLYQQSASVASVAYWLGPVGRTGVGRNGGHNGRIISKKVGIVNSYEKLVRIG